MVCGPSASVPPTEVEPLKFTTWSSSGVTGEKVNFASVGIGIVDVVTTVVVVDVVVSVIFTTPGPVAVLL
jgi:hypothetical protein